MICILSVFPTFKDIRDKANATCIEFYSLKCYYLVGDDIQQKDFMAMKLSGLAETGYIIKSNQIYKSNFKSSTVYTRVLLS